MNDHHHQDQGEEEMGAERALATRRVRQLQAAAPISTTKPIVWSDEQGTEISLSVPQAKGLFKSKNPFTDAEMVLFLHLCRSRRANPFIGDMYPIKYSREDPAAFVTGYHYLMGQVKKNSAYRGFSLHYVDSEGKRIADGLETKGNVVAAICLVRIQGYDEPVKFVARMTEFNKGRAQWTTMPVVMLGKCAIANAHRLADPGLAGMYIPEEMGQEYVPAPEDKPIEGEILSERTEDIPPEPSPEASAEVEPDPEDPTDSRNWGPEEPGDGSLPMQNA